MNNPYGQSSPINVPGGEILPPLAAVEPTATKAGRGARTAVDGWPHGAEPGREPARAPGVAGPVVWALPPSSPSFPTRPPGADSTAFLAQRIAQETASPAIGTAEDDRSAEMSVSPAGSGSRSVTVRAGGRDGFDRRRPLAWGLMPRDRGYAGIDFEA